MILHIIVKPQKKFDRIEKKADHWQVSIKAKPIDNEANEYLVNYLSEALNLPVSNIRIKRGHHSRNKQIEILADESAILQKLEVARSIGDSD
jgi:uncharacterized protein YggU (UPF0235/DUF167 family)